MPYFHIPTLTHFRDLSNEISGHQGRIERHYLEFLCLVLKELLILPLAALMLQPRNVLGVYGNDRDKALATVPRLITHGIEERGERILLHLLRSGERFCKPTLAVTLLKLRLKRLTELRNCIHALNVAHVRQLSNIKSCYFLSNQL